MKNAAKVHCGENVKTGRSVEQVSLFDQIVEIIENEARGGGLDLSDEAWRGVMNPGRASSPAPTAAREATAVYHPRPVSPPNPWSDRGEAPVASELAGSAENVETMDFDTLRRHAARCERCPLSRNRNKVVFGDGDENAELMFIGEGPGRDEDQTGVPFVGQAGKLLDKMIAAMRFRRDEVYIANIVKCRPPRNRNPEKAEVGMCLPYLRRQIQLIQPRVMVLLGSVPLSFLLNETGITRVHGQWFEFMGIRTMPTFHPTYLLRYAEAKRLAWADLRKVMAVCGKIPDDQAKQG